MSDTRDAFEYDVAVSYAESDRGTANELATRLRQKDIKVFLDEYHPSAPGGGSIIDHLVNLYARKARYCILLLSRQYPLPSWTEAERTSARGLALREADEYILPVQTDDTDVPGVREVSGYLDLRQSSVEAVVNFLERKLNEAQSRDRPPSRSHDLRSGNVPEQ